VNQQTATLANATISSSQNRAVETDVLPPGQCGMEAGADFEQASHAPDDAGGLAQLALIFNR